MISKNMPRPTAVERRRMDLFRVTGCVLTWAKFGHKVRAECHHIVMAGKRYGHWYTIPLSSWYHRGIPEAGRTKDEMRAKYGASLTDGHRSFVASHHYTELELWQKWQVTMGFDDSMPPTKILPRRVYVERLVDENSIPLVDRTHTSEETQGVSASSELGAGARLAATERKP
jgi:hypothetical protein